MKRSTERTARAVAAAGVMICAQVAAAQGSAARRDYPAEIQAELRAAAVAAVGEFPRLAVTLCMLPKLASAEADRTPAYLESGYDTTFARSQFVEPAKVFDDLYFVGDRVVSAWALVTTDGIILFDSNYGFWMDDVVLGGLQKLGLDPARIKYVLVSHAHLDHLGGAKLLQDRFGARVVMGEADWDLVARFPKRYGTMAPRRDVVATEGMAITLGGTTVRAWLTPGHTPGTLSFTFPVLDRGARVTVVYSGGTGFNFPNDTPELGIPAFQTYIESQQRAAEIAARAGATVVLTNHPWADNALDRIRMIAGVGAGRHPFDVGADGVQRYFQATARCARAAQLRLEQRQAEAARPAGAPRRGA